MFVSVLLFGYNVKNITISENNTREARISSASSLILSFGDIYKDYSYVWAEETAAPIKSYQVRLMDYHLIGEEYQNLMIQIMCLMIAKKLPNEKKLKNGEYYLIDGEAYDTKKKILSMSKERN